MTNSQYRWVIVAAGGLLGCVAIGAMFSLPVFLGAITRDTGWSVTGVSSAMTIGFLALALTSMAWGNLSDRFGPRFVVATGSIILAISLALASQTTSLIAFQVIFGLFVGASIAAIFPPMISTVIAFECLGYDRDSALVQWALRQLDSLVIEERQTVRLQPCLSPIWDTATTTIALADSRLPGYHPALLGAVHWLLEKEVRRAGDWVVRRPGIEPTGWHFQFHNELYPDLDDTAMVLLALQRTQQQATVAHQRDQHVWINDRRWIVPDFALQRGHRLDLVEVGEWTNRDFLSCCHRQLASKSDSGVSHPPPHERLKHLRCIAPIAHIAHDRILKADGANAE